MPRWKQKRETDKKRAPGYAKKAKEQKETAAKREKTRQSIIEQNREKAKRRGTGVKTPKPTPTKKPDSKKPASKKTTTTNGNGTGKSGLSRGEAITKLAAAAGKSIEKWQKTSSDEQSKTMALKDKYRAKRNERTRGRK